MVEGIKVKWNLKLLSLSSLLLALFLGFITTSGNASAANTSTSTAYVSFWSSSSPQGQVTSNVNLPWDTNVGGSYDDLQSFYLNTISMNFPITALATDNAIYGRLVMRFNPWYVNEDAYFCDKKLNDYLSSVEGVSTMCSGTVTYNYADGTTYSVSSPLYFNYSLPSGRLNAYVDYNLSLPNTALSSITFTINKTGSYDVYSVPSGYGLILSTLSGDASYYIGSSSTNLDPIINQNNTIINQNQQMYDYLTDDTPPSADTSIIGSASGWLPQGPVDSLLTLPMTFAQGIVDIFTGQHQCSPIVLPFDFINSSITIPCLDSFFSLAGVNVIWNGVGVIISAFVLYDTFKWLYKFVDDTLTLRENNSGLWGGL